MHRLYLEWMKKKAFASTHENYDNIINVTLGQYTDICVRHNKNYLKEGQHFENENYSLNDTDDLTSHLNTNKDIQN